MFQLNGVPISIDNEYTTEDGVTYPHLRDPAVRDALGVVEVEDVWYDQRFYWGVDNPKDLDALKLTWTAQIKQTAYSLLAPTDYKVVRSLEISQAVDQATLDSRTAVRAKYQELEAAINDAADVEALIAVVTAQDWPTI